MASGGARAAVPAGCMLLVALLAGCASEPVDADADGGSTVTTDIIEDEPGAVADDVGRVSGVVLHASGFTLPGARITILSVDASVSTGADGAFKFDRVDAGKQLLRVEKETYQTLQQRIEVVAGKLTKVEVVLLPAKGSEGGFSEHFHDHWRGMDTYDLYEGELAFSSDTMKVPPGLCTQLPVGVGGVTSYDPSCYYLYIYPAEGRIVPPGTSKVSADITFEPGELFEQETMYFYMVPPTDAEGKYYSSYHPISSGESHFEYEVPSPDIVDHGHATMTSWQFYIYWYSATPYGSGDWYNAMFRGPVNVAITAHAGALELDPPHQRFWKDGDTIVMETSEPTYAYCSAVPQYTCGYRYPSPSAYSYSGKTHCYYGCLLPKAPYTVPPGTTQVDFTIEWRQTTATAATAGSLFEPNDWVFGYKTAEAPGKWATWANYTWIEPTEIYDTADGQGAKFSVDVEEGQEDPFYTKLSNWAISVALRGHEDAATYKDVTCPYEACGQTIFTLVDFVAFNSNRDEMLEAGTA